MHEHRTRRTGRLGAGREWLTPGPAPSAPARLALVALLALTAALLSGRSAPSAVATVRSDSCVSGDGPAGFRADDRLVMTYLYYWYDSAALDAPALALHPPANQPFDWRDSDWHRRQLADMAEAGIDVALAVYWGDGPTWSTGGLEALVAARASLLAEVATPPAVGLFRDTNLCPALVRESPKLP